MYYLLHYDYVANIVERREPFRPGHLGLAKAFEEQGKIILAGATGNPVTGATFAFQVDSIDEIQDFIDRDPYVANNLVTSWRIEPWTVVIGSAYQP